MERNYVTVTYVFQYWTQSDHTLLELVAIVVVKE